MKTRSTRIDVQTKINRIIELMQRPQGASVKEICAELECAEKTFYRHLEKLAVQNVPYITRPDPDGKTNSVRYYIIKSAIKGSNVFLSASEKALLRIVLQNSKDNLSVSNDNKKLADSLIAKLNDGIIHDTKESEIKLMTDFFSSENVWDYDENFIRISEALELKQSITFKSIHNPEYGKGKYVLQNPLEKKLIYEFKFSAIENDSIFQVYSIVNKDGQFWALGKVVPLRLLEDNEKLPVEIRRVKIQGLKDIRILKQYPYLIPEDYDFDYWYKFYWGSKKTFVIHLAMNKNCFYRLRHESGFEPKAVYIYGGQIHLIIEAQDFLSIERYVLGLGPRVQIISPKSFADKIKTKSKEIIELYRTFLPENFSEMQEIKIQLKNIDKNSDPRLLRSNIYRSWWRNDLDLRQKEKGKSVSHSLYCFDVPGLKKIVAVAKNHANGDFLYRISFKTKRLEMPFSTIFYEDRIAYEVPFEDVIDYDMDFFLPVLKKYCAQNLPENFERLIAENKGLDEKTKKEILKRKEKYSQNKPILLLTGIDRIKPEWADEILRKGTFHGIPAHAVLLKEECSEDGTLNITAYKY